MSHYAKRRCPICRKRYSICGFAWASHEAAHVRDGEAVYVDRNGSALPLDLLPWALLWRSDW